MATLKEKRLARITRTAAIRALARRREEQVSLPYSQLAMELVHHLRAGAMNG